MGVVGEDDGEVAGAEAEGDGRSPGSGRRRFIVKSTVACLVVVGGGGEEFQGAAAEVLRAGEEELDVGVLEVGFVALRVALLRHILAHDRLHAVRQKGRTVVHGQTRGSNEVQRGVQGRRKAFVQADVFDMVVDHFE